MGDHREVANVQGIHKGGAVSIDSNRRDWPSEKGLGEFAPVQYYLLYRALGCLNDFIFPMSANCLPRRTRKSLAMSWRALPPHRSRSASPQKKSWPTWRWRKSSSTHSLILTRTT